MMTHVTRAILVALTATAAAGCFGPFAKKKSSSGGGGGATTQQASAPTPAGPATPGATPAGPAAAPTPPAPAGARDGYGCLQGVVIDGFTGQRVDIAKVSTGKNGMFVLIRDTKLPAKAIADDPNLVGEYHICDIPVEKKYPVFAYFDGYEPFESDVTIVSTRPIRTTATEVAVDAEVKIPDPVELKNIVVWPKNTAGRDLVVRVFHNGAPVKGALVDVEPTGTGDAFQGNWMEALVNSADDRILPLPRVLTNDDGVATFAKDLLSLGHAYKVSVTAASESGLTSVAARQIILGITDATATDENTFELNVTLDDANKGIKVISCSKQFQDYAGNGVFTFIFNRDVTIVNARVQLATVAGGAAALQTDDTADMDPETMTAAASGQKITLSPNFTGGTAPKTPDQTKLPTDGQNVDKDLIVSYDTAKIFIKVTGDNDANFKSLKDILAQGAPADAPVACKPTAGDNVSMRFFVDYD